MRIQIGQAIARLRRERGITQDALAEAVGVSAPAVSKWETGQSYPDITLLPPLARFFGVSTDTLLAYQDTLTDDDREALYAEVSAIFKANGWHAGLARCEALLHEHPADAPLRILLSAGLMQNMVFAADDTERAEARTRQLAWLREAVAVAEGNDLILAQYQLALYCLNARQLDEADVLLSSLSMLEINPRQIMPTLRMQQGRYDEATRLAQQNLLAGIGDILTNLLTLTSLAVRLDMPDAAQRYADAGETVAALFSLPSGLRTTAVQAQMAVAHARGDREALLSAAQRYADGVRSMALGLDSPFFDRLSAGSAIPAPARDSALAGLVADGFETNPAYDNLRDDPRFMALIQSLRQSSSL